MKRNEVEKMRKGMMVGKGKKGYHNVVGKDPKVHSQSAKGIKQPQKVSARLGSMKCQKCGRLIYRDESHFICEGNNNIPKARGWVSPESVNAINPSFSTYSGYGLRRGFVFINEENGKWIVKRFKYKGYYEEPKELPTKSFKSKRQAFNFTEKYMKENPEG